MPRRVSVLAAALAGLLSVPLLPAARAQTGAAGFPLVPVTGQRATCTAGAATVTMAGQSVRFPCAGVDLMSYLPLSSIGGATNDNAGATPASLATTWGWTDPSTGREYVLLGRSDGTAFVDVTDPLRPVYVGRLKRPAARTDAPTTPVAPSQWRELKVLGNTMVVVSEAAGAGMQTFDLTGLRTYTGGAPLEFAETARYTGFGRAHNVLVSEASGTAIATGLTGAQNANTTNPGAGCALGLHAVRIASAATPTFDACYNAPSLYGSRGYTHDAQCVRYRGPDTRYTGREICLLSNETGLFVVDLTDRAAITTVGSMTYPNAAYIHQAWFTEDQRHAYLDDELDEQRGLVPKTRTFILDLTDLRTPVLAGTYDGPSTAIDHNQYIRGRYLFQANYTAGVRILDTTTPTAPTEAAYFDTFPASDNTVFEGIWNVYPYFPSGTIVAGGIREGLFVLRAPGLALGAEPPPAPGASALARVGAHPAAALATLRLTPPTAGHARVEAFDATGRRVATLLDAPVDTTARTLTWDTRGLAPGVYTVRALLPDGAVSVASVVVAR